MPLQYFGLYLQARNARGEKHLSKNFTVLLRIMKNYRLCLCVVPHENRYEVEFSWL